MSIANINGLNIGYDVEGSGPAFVLLHGFPFNRSMWSEQVEALRDSYKVITPDLRGHGESDATDEPATMEAMAEDVAVLMDHLGIERAVIGGLSMGGYVALAFYRRFELRVRALVLADTRASADTDEARQNREKQAQRSLTEGMNSISDDMLSKLFSPATVTTRPDTLARVRKMMTSTNPRGAAAALRGIALRADQRENLHRIIPPVLIIVGKDDQITPVADSEFMHAEIGGSHLEVIEGAGHVSNIEQPGLFNEALVRFVNSV